MRNASFVLLFPIGTLSVTTSCSRLDAYCSLSHPGMNDILLFSAIDTIATIKMKVISKTKKKTDAVGNKINRNSDSKRRQNDSTNCSKIKNSYSNNIIVGNQTITTMVPNSTTAISWKEPQRAGERLSRPWYSLSMGFERN